MQISVFVPPTVAAWLTRKAADESFSRSLFVRRLIVRAFDLDNPKKEAPPTFDRHADATVRTLPLPFKKKKSAKKGSRK